MCSLPLLADIVAKVFLGWRTKILRAAADALCARRREGPYRFIRGAAERRSNREVQRSTFARFLGLLDFRLLQQYLPGADIGTRYRSAGGKVTATILQAGIG